MTNWNHPLNVTSIDEMKVHKSSRGIATRTSWAPPRDIHTVVSQKCGQV